MTKFMIVGLIMFLAPIKEVTTPQVAVEKFFTTLLQNKVDQAYDTIFKGSAMNETKPQALITLKKQTTMALSLYGKLLSTEMVREETFGKSVVRLVYILKTEQVPIVWQFYFLSPQHGLGPHEYPIQ